MGVCSTHVSDGGPSLYAIAAKRGALVVGGLLWAMAIGFGFFLLEGYNRQPGSSAALASDWPRESRIHRGRQATLVMAVHPHCPCSRASIAELTSVITHTQGRLAAYVLFVRPEGSPEGWEQTGLWDDAAAIPGVEVIVDVGGEEARRFGAETSGHAFLYGKTGELLFSGGITSARGHRGDNDGRNAIIELAAGSDAAVHSTPVFGCPLFVSDDANERRKRSEGQ